MGEGLNDLLARHHLLNESLFGGEGLLLGDHVRRGQSAEPAGDDHHEDREEDDEDRQPQTELQHDGDEGRDCQTRLDESGQGLADELADRIRVIRVGRHNRPVGVSVEIFDRKRLHAVEHVIAHVFEGPLRHRRHDPRIHEVRDDAEQVDDAHHGDDTPQQYRHRVVADGHAGRDHLVNDPLEEHHGHGRRG